ncbi:MAG: hypothetical protein JNL58_06210 [Planctomyces sp.]|nr:hypothetical protein [Planctomyces sp.]
MKPVDSTLDLCSAPLPAGSVVGRGQSLVPQLLVSARSAVECLEAIRGGAEILDLKEPSEGALGRVTTEQLARCLTVLEAQSANITISLAMGELLDWGAQLDPSRVAFLNVVRAHKHRIRFLKFGLAGCDEFSLRANWLDRLSGLRTHLAEPVEDDEAQAGTQQHDSVPAEPYLIPACYADWRQAASPSPGEVVSALPELVSAGMLIDTFIKNGTGVFGCLTTAELSRIARECRATGVFLALAGQIAAGDLGAVAAVNPEIIGVRGAVCREGRQSSLDGELVRSFRNQLYKTFQLAVTTR